MSETNPPRTLGAVMSAEAGFEGDEDGATLRVSGFLALLAAVISGFGVVAPAMAAFAALAIGFGVFALRKSDAKTPPVGTTAARLAVALALLLGSCALARPLIKRYMLGRQAEYFAREFVKVASQGNEAYVAELQKSYVNRFLKTMPLEAQYQEQRERINQMRLRDGDAGGGMEAPELSSIGLVSGYSPDHEWFLDRPVHVFYTYGRTMARVVLASDRSEKPFRIMVLMEYLVHKDRGTLEWHVDTFQAHQERLVAESVL
ncbi:MAG: hypothetical protein AAFU85_17445 [Planctomycetota bacterium]